MSLFKLLHFLILNTNVAMRHKRVIMDDTVLSFSL